MVDYAHLPLWEIQRHALNIHPGEWAVETRRPIATLLGSCVAVCLFDSGLPIAGLNHFLLPKITRGPHAQVDAELAGDACMTALLNAMLARGAARHRLRAKAFGGGAVIDVDSPILAIGQRNAQFTEEWLDRENIPLVASDMLGPWARKVLVLPETGDALCKRMPTSMASTRMLKQEEEAYARSMVQQDRRAPKVELF